MIYQTMYACAPKSIKKEHLFWKTNKTFDIFFCEESDKWAILVVFPMTGCSKTVILPNLTQHHRWNFLFHLMIYYNLYFTNKKTRSFYLYISYQILLFLRARTGEKSVFMSVGELCCERCKWLVNQLPAIL